MSSLAIVTTRSLAFLSASSLKAPPNAVKKAQQFSTSPISIAWSMDNTSLFAVSSSTFTHLSSTGDINISVPLKNGAENLLVKDQSTLLFSVPGTSKIYVSSPSNPDKPTQTIDTHKSPNTITSLSLSNDGSLLASTCANGAHVHNLTLNAHTVLRGIPSGGITTSAFHPHARTRLLLGIGAQLVIYDTTRPSSPIKTIPIATDTGTQDQIVAIACSPFSKTLVSVGMRGGCVGLVDLEKAKALFRVLPTHMPLTTLTFSPSGASILAGTENGKVLVVDLRALDRLAGTVYIEEEAESGNKIVGIAVQKKYTGDPQLKPTNAPANMKPEQKRKSSISAGKGSLPPSPAQNRKLSSTASTQRTVSMRHASGKVGDREKGKEINEKDKLKGNGGTGKEGSLEREKKKASLPICDPLGNCPAGISDAQKECLSPHQAVDQDCENRLLKTLPQSKSEFSLGQTPAATIHNVSNESPRSSNGLHTRTRTLSGDSHDAADRPELITSVRSKDSTRARSRTGSSASGRLKSRTEPDGTDSESASSRSRTSSTAKLSTAGQARFENRNEAPGLWKPLSKLRESPSVSFVRPPSSNGRLSYGTNPSSPDLPMPSPVKDSLAQYQFTSKDNAAILKTPAKRTRREEDTKKVVFSRNSDCETESEEGDCQDEKKMSVVVSPQRRSPAGQPHAWSTIPSPLLRNHDRSQSQSLHQSPRRATNAPQDLLRLLLSDVLSDFQRTQHADLMGLHLDFVKMGRGWTKELEDIKKELAELRQENRQLREENDRLRRGY